MSNVTELQKKAALSEEKLQKLLTDNKMTDDEKQNRRRYNAMSRDKKTKYNRGILKIMVDALIDKGVV